MSNEYAIFVAPTGKDGAGGSKAGPVKTIAKALELAGDSKIVIACSGSFDEQVKLIAGAKLYGGFACPGSATPWNYESGKTAKVAPSTRGVALSVSAGAAAVVVEDFEFNALGATDPGESSVAAFVNASTSVTFKRVALTAGGAANGLDGALQPFSYALQPSLNGNPEKAGADNGAEKVCTCQTGLMSVGGVGGTPSASGQSGAKGLPDRAGGAGGDPSLGDCSGGSGGKKGGDSSAASPSVGAATLGAISSLGWLPTSGVDGANGSPGQGGGGGASFNSSGHGGGGGCGGCGGNGAKGGQGGGASIALLVVDSPMTLDGCMLTSKDAGGGGAGHAGQSGQQDGGGGVALSTNSCQGGAGGKGGNGGASGGGAGGVSVGVLWKGAMAPTLTDTTTSTGNAGAAGIGGVPGTNDGIAGVKQDVLQVP